jgi:DNA-binding CsgD family transcriptional regulator
VAAISTAELGDAARAGQLAGAAAAAAAGRGKPQSDQMRWAAGVTNWLAGDPAAAALELSAAASRQRAGGWGAGPFARFITADLAEVAAGASDPSLGATVDDLLDGIETEGSGPPLEAVIRFARGAAALARSEAEEAAVDLEPAASALAEAGWPLFHGRTLALLGRAAARIGRREAALEAFQGAAERFEASGAVVRRQWVVEDLRRLGAKGRRVGAAVAGPASLTRREREVVRLAVGGAKAREIAEALFIGERTVETHLASVYAKLGISSRAELTRLGPTLDL